ncbi:MAG: glutathione S-transferase family protein [Maricaulaceae bacterium]
MTKPITLYGVKISMFTGKVRSYLIKQAIPFSEVAPVSEHFSKVVLPQLGRQIIPVIETEDGTLVQDTTDIIDYIEDNGTVSTSAYPADPLKKLLSLILELFGDEGLLRPAMHYRWNFSEQTDKFITHGFGGWQGPDMPAQEKSKIEKTMGKFKGFLPALGVTADTIPEVERSFDLLMEILEAHFARTPYLFGSNPTIGDYGMMCSLYAHLARDPVPSARMKNRAPSLFRWTERMNSPHADYSDMPYYAENADLPETLGALFGYIADYFLPELQMNVDTLNALPGGESGELATINPQLAVLGFGSFIHGNTTIQCAVRPIRFYMLQRVTDCFAQMTKIDQDIAMNYLNPLGLAPLLELTANHRIARQDHREVWA